jgi:hypothetical protein
MDAGFIIEHLGLTPLPFEGGYFRETYRSGETIARSCLPSRYRAEKRFSTAIYYLITPDTFSALHCVSSDELFHFYLGDTVIMLQLCPDGTGKTVVLGHDLERGQHPQCVVPGGTWQGLALDAGGTFALMGTTVAPAFDPEDFVLGKRTTLIEHYPQFADMIIKLTRE